MSSETDSQAVVPVAMDVDVANHGAPDGDVQAAAADAGNGTSDVVVVEAAERGQEDDGKVNASDVVKEGEKKEARKQMAARSEMWKHFEKIVVDGKLQKGKCNNCKTDIAAHPVINGTSALGKHFRVCKRNPHKNSHDEKQAVLHNSGDSVHAWKFDPEAIRAAFICMIIEDELPFAFGGKSGFRKFMAIACPRFSIPSRRTCTRDTVGAFFEEKAKLKLIGG